MRRRQVLGLPLLPLLAAVPVFAAAEAGEADRAALLLSAASDSEGRHWLQAFSMAEGRARPRYRLPLPARAHHIAIHEASDRFVVVARRPGDYLVVGELASGRQLAILRTPPDRHLYGHGVFAADGSLFYAVENDFEDRQGDSGRVAVWRFSGQGAAFHARRLHDFPSHGVGPHELALMPDGDALVVANGGMRTHPDSGREVLNPDTMQPSLVYLDAGDGRLLERRRLPDTWHQSSIRHLDVNAGGQVALAMQYQGAPFEQAPLVALHRRGEALRLPEVPPEALRQMQQYCGSVRFDREGRYLAVSCPRGNRITFWDAVDARYLGHLRSRDGCGLSALERGFLYSAGSTGRLAWHDPASGEGGEVDWDAATPLLWDNHLSRAGRFS